MKQPKPVCQSCASPVKQAYDKGTESHGGPSEIYCKKCYRLGAFIDPTMTVEKMHEDMRLRMVRMKFPRFLAKLLANQIYTLQRWDTEKN